MGGGSYIRRRLSGGWDALAPSYDLQRPLERAAVECLLDLLQPSPSDRLLDLGTGTGAVLVALAARADRPTDVTGVDASAAMLARVPALPTGWSLLEDDVTALRLPGASFDAITASYLLHVMPRADRRRAVTEMARLLRRGGRAAIAVPALPRGILKRPYGRAIGVLGRRSASAFGLLPIEPWAELTRAGLRPVRGSYLRSGYPTLCVLAEKAAVSGRTGARSAARAPR